MSESYGSILELSEVTRSSNVKLLIIADGSSNIRAIAASLYAASINFTYDMVNADCLAKNLSRQQYSAILYDGVHSKDVPTDRSLAEKLQWWCSFYPHTPLILITDTLNDRLAVELDRTGVSDYIFTDRLDLLPIILKKALEKSVSNFVSQQTLIEQQQQIEQLQSELRSCKDNEQIQQALIEQQQQQIEQLQSEVRSWIDDEQNKQEHLAYLSHELRSPVSSMLGFARMLKEQYYGTLNQKQMQYADAMVKVGGYMLKLVNNYLDLAKINADKQTLDFHKLPVEEICHSSIAELLGEETPEGLELKLEIEDQLDFCTVDSHLCKQILINLLSNAIKFTNEGSVTLRVRGDGNLLYFAVIDTGEGISAENMNKLFQPFPQITHRHDSTGLGLTLSKQLARLHGGDITVTSELGKGSCFTLQIPQHQ